jgi:hypothetical protein
VVEHYFICENHREPEFTRVLDPMKKHIAVYYFSETDVLIKYLMDEYLRRAAISRTLNSDFPLNVSVHRILAQYHWTEQELYGNMRSGLSI